MNFLMIFSSGRFNHVGYPNSWVMVASTMVRSEVIFWQETLLKNMNSRWKQVPGSRCSVKQLGAGVCGVPWK